MSQLTIGRICNLREDFRLHPDRADGDDSSDGDTKFPAGGSFLRAKNWLNRRNKKGDVDVS